MAKIIKASVLIIEWDAELGRVAVLNPGDEGEVGDRLAEIKIAEGAAELVAEEASSEDEAAAAAAPAAKRGKVKPAAAAAPADESEGDAPA